MNKTAKGFAWGFVAVVGLLAGGYLLMGFAAEPTDAKGLQLEAFGRLPVVDNGRVKPIDTLARVNLMILSGRQEYKDEQGDTQPALRWLLDVMTAGQRQSGDAKTPIAGESKDVRAYRIEEPQLRQSLGLDNAKGVLFSFQEIYQAAGPDRLKELFEQASSIGNPEDATLSARDKALASLAAQMRGHLLLASYETPQRIFRIDNEELLALLGLESREGFRYGIGEFLAKLTDLEREARRANRLKPKDRSVFDQKAYDLFKRIELYVGLARGNAETLHLVAPSFKGDTWKTLPEAQEALQNADRKNPEALKAHASTIAWISMLLSYERGEAQEFNRAVTTYNKLLTEVLPEETQTASTEASFNAFAPFYRCSVLYVLVFVLACVFWLWPEVVINRFAFWLMVLTVLVHTFALAARMWIQGRPPVTNLYSSAVFIGWACVVFCVFLELKYRNALATAVAGLTGFSTLLIAHYLGGSGDTLEMMQAVLDTNFWLATHVTTVTIGYSATFVAGMFGILFLWRMLVTSILNGLRDGGVSRLGSSIVFGLSAVTMSVLAMLVVSGIVYGLWYLTQRSPSISGLIPVAIVRAVAGLLLLAGVGFGFYLLWQWLGRSPHSSSSLPKGTQFLERFAFTDDARKVLAWMIYGTICFAMLFSFVGTVLGGIWADQSWGRFWGWDPKENGALLIVIMNALILHARWGGMIKDRGMATLAIVGNMVTMWSWFGTNQLGIGLHAYGFNNALVLLCRWFWISQLILIGLALLPLQGWRNYVALPVKEELEAKSPTTRLKSGKRERAGIQPV